ncbi:MAG: hypothetical protein WAP03_21870 [Methylorubrum rhodinum]|uniref:hypothetical protein n=1 Tax=Methylorubrum rhodinum TaxID=29428 RepID=UPI003BB16E1A
MAAASPIPALAARFAELREDAARLVDALRDDETAAGRSLSTSLRQFLRDTAAPNDRLQTMGAAAATVRVEFPAPRRSGFRKPPTIPSGRRR